MNSIIRFWCQTCQKKKHIAADDLFRRSFTNENLMNQIYERNINDFIDAELNFLRISFIAIDLINVLIENNNYSIKFKEIIIYFLIFRKSSNMIIKQFNIFKYEALRYKIQDDHLFRRNNKNIFMRRVIDFFEIRLKIIQQFHDQSSHRKKKNTYRKIVDRYWWNNLHDEIKRYIQICESCQKRTIQRQKKFLHLIWIFIMWQNKFWCNPHV